MMTRTALACLGPVAAGAFESRQTPRRNPAADEVAITVAAASVNPIDVRRAEGLRAAAPVVAWRRQGRARGITCGLCSDQGRQRCPISPNLSSSSVSVFPSLSASRSTKQTRLSSTSGKAGLAEPFLRHDAKRRDIGPIPCCWARQPWSLFVCGRRDPLPPHKRIMTRPHSPLAVARPEGGRI
jgi:hypothetical protein